jgi:hypothetical protein
MVTRGELLALVDGAPGRLRTLQAALTTWTHRGRIAEVHRRTDEEHVPVASDDVVVDLVGDDLDDDLDDPAGNGSRLVVVPDDDPELETVATSYVVVAPPDRWRVVGRGYLAVSDGRRSWAGTSTLVTERDSANASISDAGPIGSCLYPGPLLRNLTFTVPEPGDIEGRPCWFVTGEPRTAGRKALPRGVAGWRTHRDLVGIDHAVWFDALTGIILRHEGSIDGEPCSSTSLTDLVFDGGVDSAEFRPPPGAVVRSRHELLRDHLAAMGIDPDTVDLDDPVQVREALRQGG